MTGGDTPDPSPSLRLCGRRAEGACRKRSGVRKSCKDGSSQSNTYLRRLFFPLAQTLIMENKATTQYSKCHISAQSSPVSKYTAQNTK